MQTVGISQMDLQFYDHLSKKRDDILACIRSLFVDIVHEKFDVETCKYMYHKKETEWYDIEN